MGKDNHPRTELQAPLFIGRSSSPEGQDSLKNGYTLIHGQELLDDQMVRSLRGTRLTDC